MPIARAELKMRPRFTPSMAIANPLSRRPTICQGSTLMLSKCRTASLPPALSHMRMTRCTTKPGELVGTRKALIPLRRCAAASGLVIANTMQ